MKKLKVLQDYHIPTKRNQKKSDAHEHPRVYQSRAKNNTF